MRFKYNHNCHWLLLFHHNVVDAGFFANKEEAKFCSEPNKFSILLQLDEDLMYNSKYEFLLEYSGFDYIQWTQTQNPMTHTENDTDPQSLGTVIKHNQYESFRGLALSISSSTRW